MKRSLVVAALLLAGAAPAVHAQAMVVRPAAPLDSARAGVRDAVLVLRDSLQLVHAESARLRRDFRAASAPALVSRARAMRDACAASARTLPATRAVLADGPAPDEKVARLRTQLVAEADRVAAALAACEETFGGWARAADGEAVRGYGNRRADELRSPIRAYEARLDAYLRSIGIRIRPIGAGAPLVAG
jgi:hypothetical protein